MKWKKLISNKRILIVCFSIGLLIILLNITLTFVYEPHYYSKSGAQQEKSELSLLLQTSVDHIVINGNSDWSTLAATESWCSGSGSMNDPYIIENVIIDASTTIFDDCMMISNTDVYFIVRDSIFKNGDAGYAQVLLSDVSNGQILKNLFSNSNHYGVGIHGNNNFIMENKVEDNVWGMAISGLNNKVSKNLIDNSEYIGLKISDNHTTIAENKITNNENQGILVYGDHNTIFENTFNNPSGIGLAININSYNNTIRRNSFENNLAGVQITIGASENKIFENCFSKNDIHATDYSLANTWDNGAKGNYWDDYTGSDSNNDGIGDIPYNISGSGNNIDNYPLMSCPLTDNGVSGYSIFLIISLISIISTITILKNKKSKLKIK